MNCIVTLISYRTLRGLVHGRERFQAAEWIAGKRGFHEFAEGRELHRHHRGSTNTHGQISQWMDRLTEYNIEVHHRPATANVIRIADGLSRFPKYLRENPIKVNTEHISMSVIMVQTSDRLLFGP